MSDVNDRVKEMCINHDIGDYHEVNDNNSIFSNKKIFEKLYSLDLAIDRLKEANEDCHKFIKHLGSKLNMTEEETYNLFIDFNSHKNFTKLKERYNYENKNN